MKPARLVALSVVVASAVIGVTTALAVDNDPPGSADSVTGLQQPAATAPSYVSNALNLLNDHPEGVPDDLVPGAVDPSQPRLLLSDLGSHGEELYAVPTSKGWTCWVITNGPASCVDEFDADTPAGWTLYDADGVGTGQPAAIGELVPDGVVSVTVIVGGGQHPATTKNNGFFYEAEGANVPDALELRYSDGTAGEIRIEGGLETPAG